MKEMKNKIVIAGGTGFIGKAISSFYINKNYQVIILTRGKSQLLNGITFQYWDGETLGEWVNHLEGTNLLINLTGKSVNCRYTKENKQLILSSRVNATRVLGEAIQQLQKPPQLWINASTATIYDYSLTKAMTEEHGDIGNDFSMSVAQAWENALNNSLTPKTRKIALRISLVLGKHEGVLPVLTKLTKVGLGGFHGNGNQKFAWIHIDDVLNMLEFLQNQTNLEGPINCVSPSTINNREFMKALRKVLKIPFGIPTPTVFMKFGAWIMQTESELILKSRFVAPKKILDAGFKFKHTNIEESLKSLI